MTPHYLRHKTLADFELFEGALTPREQRIAELAAIEARESAAIAVHCLAPDIGLGAAERAAACVRGPAD